MELKETIDTTDVADFVEMLIRELMDMGRATFGVVSDGEYVANAAVEELTREDQDGGVLLTLRCWPDSMFHVWIHSLGEDE